MSYHDTALPRLLTLLLTQRSPHRVSAGARGNPEAASSRATLVKQARLLTNMFRLAFGQHQRLLHVSLYFEMTKVNLFAPCLH